MEDLGTQPSITPEQAAQLEAGPGAVKEPAGLPSREELRGSLNNYFLHFSSDEGFAGPIYRAQPHWKRFEITYPELAARLREAYPRLKDYEEIDVTYDLMRALVDKNDPGVLSDDGVVDDRFLTR